MRQLEITPHLLCVSHHPHRRHRLPDTPLSCGLCQETLPGGAVSTVTRLS